MVTHEVALPDILHSSMYMRHSLREDERLAICGADDGDDELA